MDARVVTVIGLGPMGRAMADVLLAKGYEVTVWNRTAGKAEAVAAKGARRAATAGEALAASELVLLSLTDYRAMYQIIEPAASALSGRVLVNLGSSTPDEARAAARWAGDRGAQFLAGAVQVPPAGIGAPGSATFYSGPREVLEAHRDTLEVLTGCDYRGEDPGLAAVYYQIGIDLFWSTMTGYLHAMALARAYGISANEYLPYATQVTSVLMPGLLGVYAPRIDADQHSGDLERLAMTEASLDHLVRTATDAGIDTTLPWTLLTTFRAGMASGHGDDSATSLIEIFSRPGTETRTGSTS